MLKNATTPGGILTVLVAKVPREPPEFVILLVIVILEGLYIPTT
jgi:hypothetical protein